MRKYDIIILLGRTSMFARYVNYAEIWFCNEYFIADVNIMAESNSRSFIKEIDLILGQYNKTSPYRKIKGAKLYRFDIGNKKFKIAIAEMELGIYLIAYLSGRDVRISAKVSNNDSRKRNKDLLYDFALKNYIDEENSGAYIYQYSKNRDKRLKMEETIDAVKVDFEKFCLNPDATIDFPKNLKENPYAFLGWYEDDRNRSIYQDLQTAIQDCKNYLE